MNAAPSDEASIAHLDMEIELGCEAMGCENAAAVSLMCRNGAGTPMLLCGMHLAEDRKNEAIAIREHRTLMCLHCGGKGPSIDDLMSVVPL